MELLNSLINLVGFSFVLILAVWIVWCFFDYMRITLHNKKAIKDRVQN
jgi:hypothetical protein